MARNVNQETGSDMNVILNGVLCAVCGFALNQTLEDLTHDIFDDFPDVPRNNKTRLVQYVEGVMLLFFLIIGFIEIDKEIPRPIKNKIEKTMFLTAFWTGGGVVIANIFNTWRNMRDDR
jgi:Na+/H+ antiporter NhaA